jgi:hypothetical protein
MRMSGLLLSLLLLAPPVSAAQGGWVGAWPTPERYLTRFANANVRADIVRRVTFGHFAIDHEQITAPPAPGMIEAIALCGSRVARSCGSPS